MPLSYKAYMKSAGAVRALQLYPSLQGSLASSLANPKILRRVFVWFLLHDCVSALDTDPMVSSCEGMKDRWSWRADGESGSAEVKA